MVKIAVYVYIRVCSSDWMLIKVLLQIRAMQLFLQCARILQGIYATEGLRPVPKPPLSVRVLLKMLAVVVMLLFPPPTPIVCRKCVCFVVVWHICTPVTQ